MSKTKKLTLQIEYTRLIIIRNNFDIVKLCINYKCL